MKILFDQGTPVPLRKTLSGHEVETAYERAWGELKNGELLAEAEAAGFDLLMTTDQNLRYQQNLNLRKIAIIVLRSTSWPKIQNNTDIERGRHRDLRRLQTSHQLNKTESAA